MICFYQAYDKKLQGNERNLQGTVEHSFTLLTHSPKIPRSGDDFAAKDFLIARNKHKN